MQISRSKSYRLAVQFRNNTKAVFKAKERFDSGTIRSIRDLPKEELRQLMEWKTR
jgi:uncharacterized protein (DUF2267 family)